jgi:hypothetical protein
MNEQIQDVLNVIRYNLDGVIADVEKFDGFDDVCLQTIKRVRNVIAEALEQPAQEPVAWLQEYENQNGDIKHTVTDERIGINDIPVYTNPHQWQGLTDDEIIKHWDSAGRFGESWVQAVWLARDIEQALKDKNT